MCVAGRAYRRVTGDGGVGRGPESYDRKKVWPSINLNTFWSYLSLEVEVDECKYKDEQDTGEKSCAQAADNVNNGPYINIKAPCLLKQKLFYYRYGSHRVNRVPGLHSSRPN